jgi:hypothetical protein
MDVNDNFTQSVHQAQMDRIAELEAENERWKDLYMKAVEGNHPTENYYQMTALLREQYRAELAALKAELAKWKWVAWKAAEYGAPRVHGLVSGGAVATALDDLCEQWAAREETP